MRPFYRFFKRISSQGPERLPEQVLFSVLVFCSFFFGLAVLVRSLLYRFKILPSYQAGVPVISVGNLTAGGTGKTPVVDHLSRIFQARGKKTAVVSRGYGREDRQALQLVCAGEGPLIPPELAGDEPFLLARRNPSLVVVAAVKRSRGVEAAVKEHHAEVIILDDGFQHLAVQRDLNIVLLDALRPFGNGRVLPAGPLREFPSALKRGDLFILTRATENGLPDLKLPGDRLSCRHVISNSFYSLGGAAVELASLKTLRGGAFAGIANPERFFSDLASAGLNIVKTLAFHDHVKYGKMEKNRLAELGQGVDYLVTTEKDAVKLRQGDLPTVCYAAPLELEFSEPGKLDAVLDGLL